MNLLRTKYCGPWLLECLLVLSPCVALAESTPPAVTPQAALSTALEKLKLADGEYFAGFVVELKAGEEMNRFRRSLDAGGGYVPERLYWSVVFDVRNTKEKSFYRIAMPVDSKTGLLVSGVPTKP